MTTVSASIPVLRWAAHRARLHDDDLAVRFRKWPLWLNGEAQPTLKQLEDFARLTHTAIGYFFLPEPPALALPVPDFRTLRDEELREPSPAFLDTLYLCQQRQDWYRDHARVHGLSRLAFVGSALVNEAPQAVAERMRTALKLSTEERRQLPTWTDALRQLIAKVEEAGVMVMLASRVHLSAFTCAPLSTEKADTEAWRLEANPTAFAKIKHVAFRDMLTRAHLVRQHKLAIDHQFHFVVGVVIDQRLGVF